MGLRRIKYSTKSEAVGEPTESHAPHCHPLGNLSLSGLPPVLPRLDEPAFFISKGFEK